MSQHWKADSFYLCWFCWLKCFASVQWGHLVTVQYSATAWKTAIIMGFDKVSLAEETHSHFMWWKLVMKYRQYMVIQSKWLINWYDTEAKQKETIEAHIKWNIRMPWTRPTNGDWWHFILKNELRNHYFLAVHTAEWITLLSTPFRVSQWGGHPLHIMLLSVWIKMKRQLTHSFV